MFENYADTVCTSTGLSTSEEPTARNQEKPNIQTQGVSEVEQVITYEMT